jgi:hypothetical protein
MDIKIKQKNKKTKMDVDLVEVTIGGKVFIIKDVAADLQLEKAGQFSQIDISIFRENIIKIQ